MKQPKHNIRVIFSRRLLPLFGTMLALTASAALPEDSMLLSDSKTGGSTLPDTVTRTLSEVTIEAKREIHNGEADILFLSDENKRFGTNALDAISSLRQFSPQLNGTSLLNLAQKEVYILINGRPSSAADLRGYSGKEVKKVTYYPVAPARYADYTQGPLIDVKIKVDSNYIYTYLSASNSLNVGYGTNQAVLRWADSLNLVKADYFIDYRHIYYKDSDIYGYPADPELSRSYSTGSSYCGNYQRAMLSWENASHGNMFFVSAMFVHNPGNRKYDCTTVTGQESGAEDDYSRTLKSLTDEGSLNLFFSRPLRKGKLDIQANGSLGRTSSDNFLSVESASYDHSRLRNNTASAFGKIQYSLPVRRVSLYFTGSYFYQHTGHHQIQPQDYTYGSDKSTLSASAALSGGAWWDGTKWYKYSLSLIMDHRDIREPLSGINLSHTRFTPYLFLGSIFHKKAYMCIEAYIRSGIPSVGQLSEIPSFQEDNLAWNGYAGLKGWTTYTVAWKPEYWIVLGKLVLNGDVSFSYTSNPVATCAFAGRPVELRYCNLDYSRDADASLFVSFRPGYNINIAPYFEWKYRDFKTPNRHLERGYFRYGGSVTFNTRKVQAVVSANAPYKSFKGDLTEYGGWNFAASVLVALPANLTLSLGWNRSSQHNRTTAYAPGILDYRSVSRIPALANQITLGVTWSCSVGVFKNRNQANVNGVDTDSGISDFNKAKM